MAAEVKARITVDAANALKRIEEINKASGYTSASMSKMAKEIGAANAALSTLGGGMGGTASGTAFKNITEQLEKQALAFSLVDSKAKAASESAALYRNAILSLTKSGSLTKEQTDMLVRSYNSYKTAAEGAKSATDAFAASSGTSATKLLSVAKNILKFQLLMGPITAAVRGFKTVLSDSVKIAAEAEQTFNKLNTVFVGVEQSATSMARSLAASLGVAGSTAAGALSTVGDLLQAQGMGTAQSLTVASGWVSKFQDIIAFKDLNMSLEEFAQNFMSGAAGNLRNFRTFGSIVKESAVNARLAAEGYDQLTGSELELAKMTTRANMALEQQANAMGATGREWNTMLSINRRLSESSKAWKENMGETFNTILKPMKSWLADILTISNRIASATEEIRTGEFTIKTQSVSDSDAEQLFKALIGKANVSDMNISEALRYVGISGPSLSVNPFTLLAELVTGRNPDKEAALMTAQNRMGYSATDIANIMKSTGITSAQISNIAQANGYTISDDVLATANSIVETWKTEQAAVLEVIAGLERLGSETDSFTESLASLAHMDFSSSNAETLFKGWNIDAANGDEYASYATTLAGNAVAVAVRNAIQQMGGLGTDAFIDNIDKAFGLGNKEEAYTSWLNEIKDLYTILYNRQKKFGDISDETLQSVVDLWGTVNKKLQQYLSEVERSKIFESGIASMQGNAASFGNQYQLVGLEGLALQTKELELTFNELKASLKEITDDEMKKLDTAYENQIAALTRLYEAQEAYAARLEAQRVVADIFGSAKTSVTDNIMIRAFMSGKKGLTSGGQLYSNMNQAQAAFSVQYLKDLQNLSESLSKLEQTVSDSGEILYKVGDSNYSLAEINETMAQYYDENMKELADAMKDLWPALGQRALGATGTLGGVIQSFQGEGDIWAKILNALMTILENTESWGEIAEVLDQIFAMFEPVTEALIDFLTSMPWDIIIFCLKVIASVIVTITKTVEMINAGINWLWYNIKEAFRSLGEVIAHPIKAANHELDIWNWKSLDDFASEEIAIYEKMVDYLGDIWDTSYKIERNTRVGDDYAKQLALLRGLYNGGVLTDAQYRGEVAKVTGSSLGSIETYSGASYATGNGGITYFSGNIVINGYNGDPEELALEIERILTKRSMAGANTH